MNYNLVLRPTLKLRDAHDSWLSRSGHPKLDICSHFIAPFVPPVAAQLALLSSAKKLATTIEYIYIARQSPKSRGCEAIVTRVSIQDDLRAII